MLINDDKVWWQRRWWCTATNAIAWEWMRMRMVCAEYCSALINNGDWLLLRFNDDARWQNRGDWSWTMMHNDERWVVSKGAARLCMIMMSLGERFDMEVTSDVWWRLLTYCYGCRGLPMREVAEWWCMVLNGVELWWCWCVLMHCDEQWCFTMHEGEWW